ncbi:hypothetical protein RIF29_11711 [Crotalaria pallida]|uniref:Cytosolic endo-beta-N-acetylglucosaminidase TIM barrel domain-containing protein n=1 Tax=Crotalaria pallida TaxID=3830 RepID=A0AAN9IMG3_CROPI
MCVVWSQCYVGLSADEDEDSKNCFLVVVAEDYPKLSTAVAGDRKFDVYMGIDVFGRRTYGGGQWNTNVALDVIRKDGVSAAIFAPGWVYETKQGPDFETAHNRSLIGAVFNLICGERDENLMSKIVNHFGCHVTEVQEKSVEDYKRALKEVGLLQ